MHPQAITYSCESRPGELEHLDQTGRSIKERAISSSITFFASTTARLRIEQPPRRTDSGGVFERVCSSGKRPALLVDAPPEMASRANQWTAIEFPQPSPAGRARLKHAQASQAPMFVSRPA